MIRSLATLLCACLLAGAATAPARAAQFNVLLFTKASGWHHDGVHAGVTEVQELGKLHDFEVFWTADAGRVMNDAELRTDAEHYVRSFGKELSAVARAGDGAGVQTRLASDGGRAFMLLDAAVGDLG